MRLHKGKESGCLEEIAGCKPKNNSIEPLAEPIAPKARGSRIGWSSLSDTELERYARGLMAREGIDGRDALRKAQGGLYDALRRRGIIDRVFARIDNEGIKHAVNDVIGAVSDFGDRLPKQARQRRIRRHTRPPGYFSSMSDDDLVKFASDIIEKNSLESRKALQRFDSGIYQALLKRKLIDALSFKNDSRRWSKYSDEELLGFAKKHIEENGIRVQKDFHKSDPSLFTTCARRGLMKMLSFERTDLKWALLSDEQLLEHASKLMAEKGIESRGKLQREDGGFYHSLRMRALLDRIPFKAMQRDWSSMDDEKIVEYAQGVVDKNELRSLRALDSMDTGLCQTVYRRHLTGHLIFHRKAAVQKKKAPQAILRFKDMDDEALVASGRKLVDEKGILDRTEFQRISKTLYLELKERGLLGKISLMGDVRKWSRYQDDELVATAQDIAEKNGVGSRTALYKLDSGLYQTLVKRKLIGKMGFGKGRTWTENSDEELLEAAARLVEEKRIACGSDLKKTKCGLHHALCARGLLGRLTFHRKERAWSAYTDAELVDFANGIIEANGITSKSSMRRYDKGLYQTLRKRGVVERLGFTPPERQWSNYSDDALVAYAQKRIDCDAITLKAELMDRDGGLYSALLRRKLIDRLRFSASRPRKPRGFYTPLSDDALISIAEGIIKAERIVFVSHLRNHSTLHSELYERGLTDRLSIHKRPKKNRDWKSISDGKLLGMAKKEIKRVGASTKNQLWKANYSLAKELKRRGLLDSLSFENRKVHNGFYERMDDKELTRYAMDEIGKKGIRTRSDLSRQAAFLYRKLRSRGLLDAVFRTIDREKEKEAVDGVLDALDSFGDDK